jgi:hypothetical protein
MATVASLLRDRVTLHLRSVDRIFMQAYVPGLQCEGQVIRFLLHRGYPIPSPAALGKIGQAFVKAIESYASEHDIPVVRFKKRQNKEKVAAPYLAKAAEQGTEAVVMIGVAQEKTEAWKGWKDGGPPSHPHFTYRRQSVSVNHYYLYCYDRAFGPCFFKFCAYAPYPVWIWANGHEWAKRQATRAGIAFTPLDNGFASCADPKRLQKICDRLDAAAVRTFVLRWLGKLPSPFTASDRGAGFFHDLAMRQIEVSDTRVFDRPATGRSWFERVIKEHLDLGRPDRVSLLFNRKIIKTTPGRFSTEVITRGVEPAIQIHYKASKLKAYYKENRALRVETTINDTRDFAIGRLVRAENFRALRAVGEQANRRFMELACSAEACAPDADTLTRVVLPSTTDGLPAPALRFGDPRVTALLSALACFVHAVAGFTNATLRELVAGLLEVPYSARQMTYDLRRLRRKGFIARLAGTHTYQLTEEGRRLAMFFSKLYVRVVTPALAQLDPTLPDDVSARSPLARTWRAFDHALDALVADSGIAA